MTGGPVLPLAPHAGCTRLSRVVASSFLVNTAAAPPRHLPSPVLPSPSPCSSSAASFDEIHRLPRSLSTPAREEATKGGAQPGIAGRRRRRGADARQGGRSARLRGSQGGGSARLRGVLCAAAASTSTFLRIAACVRKRGHATASRWRRRQRQHAWCAKSDKMGVASPHAFQDGVLDGSERARTGTRGMHRSTPTATCTARSARAPPYWRKPATHLHAQVYADFHNNTASNFLISLALHTRSKLGMPILL
uniref:Uncharacterized protein n=1 Tax=Triticum aestivum TaxID=4565 RepID=A0A077RSH7_WHEAT|nr:unnamed protein product [Triticum aestivum]